VQVSGSVAGGAVKSLSEFNGSGAEIIVPNQAWMERRSAQGACVAQLCSGSDCLREIAKRNSFARKYMDKCAGAILPNLTVQKRQGVDVSQC